MAGVPWVAFNVCAHAEKYDYILYRYDYHLHCTVPFRPEARCHLRPAAAALHSRAVSRRIRLPAAASIGGGSGRSASWKAPPTGGSPPPPPSPSPSPVVTRLARSTPTAIAADTCRSSHRRARALESSTRVGASSGGNDDGEGEEGSGGGVAGFEPSPLPRALATTTTTSRSESPSALVVVCCCCWEGMGWRAWPHR